MTEAYPDVKISPEEVGTRIKRFRELSGLSLGQAAMLANAQREEVEKTENGHYKEAAPDRLLFDLAVAYCVPLSAFFNPGTDERNPLIVLDRFARGEISEGIAAYMLSTDRLGVRLQLEQHEARKGDGGEA